MCVCLILCATLSHFDPFCHLDMVLKKSFNYSQVCVFNVFFNDLMTFMIIL